MSVTTMRFPLGTRFSTKRKTLMLTLVGVAALVIATLNAGVAAADQPNLVVYTYDSFVSWGPAQEIAATFEEAYGAKVTFVAPTGSGEMLSRLIAEIETGGTQADVFIGLSDTQLPRAIERGIFQPIQVEKIPNLANVPQELLVDPEYRAIPFDYGYVSFVYDRRAWPDDQLPASLEDLTDRRFAGRIIAIDPRTSSVGHAFLLWTIAEYGEDGYLDYWNRLKPSLLTITSGWSAAYAMFEEGEAPIVLSYTTDAAYSVYSGQGDRYGIILPGGQAYLQIELAGIVAGSDQVELAHAFLNHLLSPESQKLIPTSNWMFPANAATELPEVFEKYAVQPENPVRLDHGVVDANNERWLREWAVEIRR